MRPRLVEMLAAEAPGIDVRLPALDKRDAFELVDRGEIDLIIGSFWFRSRLFEFGREVEGEGLPERAAS